MPKPPQNRSDELVDRQTTRLPALKNMKPLISDPTKTRSDTPSMLPEMVQTPSRRLGSCHRWRAKDEVTSKSSGDRTVTLKPRALQLSFLHVVATFFLLFPPSGLAADPSSTKNKNGFDESRQQGRAKSSFLNQTTQSIVYDGIPEADLEHYQKVVAPLLKTKCLSCHGPDEQHANLRVDEISPNLLAGESVERWREIYKVLSNSEMPPDDEPEFALSNTERRQLVTWISTEMNKASFVRRNTSEHTSFRRMTRTEYNYAIQDLLGLPYPIGTLLPTETASEDGFIKNSELLQMSAMQFETYRHLALDALKRVTASGPRPEAVIYDISMEGQMEKLTNDKNAKPFHKADEDYETQAKRQHLLHTETGAAISFANPTAKPTKALGHPAIPPKSPVVLPLGSQRHGPQESKWNLGRFLPDNGTMRVSIRVGRTTMETDEHAGIRLIFSAHTSNNANFSEVISQRDVPVTASVKDPQYIHFDIPLSEIQRNPFRKLETDFPRRDEFLHIRNISSIRNNKEPLQLHIDHVRITAPHHDQWPPKTHTDIFFASPQSDNELAYGREILDRFLLRVWRRPPDSHETEQFMKLFSSFRAKLPTFEDAMLEVLATALASPEFLYLTEQDRGEQTPYIDEFVLASRLSFFLWSSIPDAELLTLAKQGKLRKQPTLENQVKRMLADPKSRRFEESFVTQWLGLDSLNSITHVKDGDLLSAIREEPIAFFSDVLSRNASVIEFLHSDYVVVNERLARHYGVRDVYGPNFHRVEVPTTLHRGGLLTGAAVMAMNSDGAHSNPLKRGVWLLERILDDPPPPPPADVPEVDLTDPRILEMTLKERIADHRNKAACASCHSRIDPWGIAFEEFDAQGAFRTHVGKTPVDATSTLFNQQELSGVDGLKQYLLSERQDQFVRAIVHKMTAYALGRPLTFSDRADVDRLAVQFRQSGDKLEDLIHLITRSDLFHATQKTGTDHE